MDLPPAGDICGQDQNILKMQLEKKINAPLTSSMGRLFDAASALIGVRQTATYEGQAAIELEAAAWLAADEVGVYPFEIRDTVADPAPLWAALLADWRAGTSIPLLAARFHNSITLLAVDLCQSIRRETGCAAVALSGGVWQNRFLLERTVPALAQTGFRVLVHRQVPANDGCIALGQVMVVKHARVGNR
jgi:hydrogenase maturation protein HypF